MKEIHTVPPDQNNTGSIIHAGHEMNKEMAVQAGNRVEEHIKQTKLLTERMEDAKAALELACTTFNKHTLHFISKEWPAALEQFRQARMAMGSETAQMMKHLEDVRKFFLGKDYEIEMKRLREFVELCERLKALKDSGFLDSVADTMLKLS